MSRWLAVAALLTLTQTTPAQIPAPWDRPAGYSTGFGPARRFATFDPGQRHVPGTFQANPTPAYARPGIGFGFGHRPGFGFVPPVAGWGGFYPAYYPPAGVTTLVLPPPADEPPPPARPAEPLDPARLSSALGAQRAAQTAAATAITTRVTLNLPADTEVWLNGTKQPGKGREFDLEVTTAKPGESVTFDLVARWPANGQTLEYTRTLTLAAGEKQSLVVARGTPVK